ncbi:MAG: chromosome segregation protein SMC, partial [Candidatus Ranarchaeia archaeon]
SELNEKAKRILKSMDQFTREAASLISEGNKIRASINRLEEKKRGQKREIGRVERANTIIRKEIEESTIKITRYETEIKNLDQRISELREQRREYANLRIPKTIREKSPEELDEMLSLLAIEIEDLLPVNQKAVDAYQEELDKYHQLKSKKDLVEHEKRTVEDFMAEIDREKKRIFMDAFNQINSNLQNIFGILSPSGKAELLLENPEDPFLGGVDIQSQPAGKTLLSTRMMSGGEKALTALSFILAIQQYRPAPFYIFDEIDASLDDVNADRIATLIKTLSKNSQFVIVSLRDVTVAKADKLIGVTRHHGKSTILTVDFGTTTEGVLELVEREARKRG